MGLLIKLKFLSYFFVGKNRFFCLFYVVSDFSSFFFLYNVHERCPNGVIVKCKKFLHWILSPFDPDLCLSGKMAIFVYFMVYICKKCKYKSPRGHRGKGAIFLHWTSVAPGCDPCLADRIGLYVM